MKTIFSWQKLSAAFLTLSLFFAATGCEKEIPESGDTQENPMQPGAFRETIQLTDGGSSVSLLVSADEWEAIQAFKETVTMKATSRASNESNPEELRFADEIADESHAVHISVVDEQLAPGFTGFSLEVNSTSQTGKVSEYRVYSGGPYYYYSWEAPHYFKVTPLANRCVSAWLYQAGSSWTFVSWAGGSGGNYLCTLFWAASSGVVHLDYRLKAQGAWFSVEWY